MSDIRPSGRPETGADLAARLRQGDPAAVQQVRHRVRRIIAFRRLQIPRHELDDLEQEIMTQVWRATNQPGFDLGGGIWGFVEVVTSRRCIDWLRSRRPFVPLSESITDSGRNPLAATLSLESTRIASEALAALDEPCRRLIVMRITHRKTFKELSILLGKSEEALRVQMHRCLRNAQRILAQLRTTRPTDEGPR